MSTRAACWLAPTCVALWLVSCGSDSPPPPPTAVTDGGAETSSAARGGSSHRGGTDSAPTAGSPDSAGQGGVGLELPPIAEPGGAAVEGSAGAPPNLPALCDPDASWGDASVLSAISTDDEDEHLLTMTHDERTLIFRRGEQLLIAERASADDELDAATPLELPAGYTSERGLALSSDGSSLVIVRSDGLQFAELGRASRSAPFDAAISTERFTYINDALMFSGARLASPVLSDDGDSLFYVELGTNRSDVWRASGNPPFSERSKLDPVTLGGDEGEAKLTLSISADERALFVFDEALGHAVGLLRATPSAEFTEPVPLPGLESAFTNAACSRLYGSRLVGASLDVVIETPH